MPPHLQKEIRSDKRLWRGETIILRGQGTWEEARRVVLEYEQREATHRTTANAVFAGYGSETGSFWTTTFWTTTEETQEGEGGEASSCVGDAARDVEQDMLPLPRSWELP